jgi:uncharacterized protein YyaL (SSP411 family)
VNSANRLAAETSPYLLQHAGNPVDWFAWGEEAFEKARREDKPVFLSVGYSTCHWCHVMERESFADEELARVLNAAFVCVKVDREERPDIDQHYMAVCQMLTGTGGWPLTVVMTPDRRPFFAGTYFPKSRRWGRPGLLELVPLIVEAWRTRREEVLRSADGIFEAVERGRRDGGEPARPASGPSLSAATLDEAFGELAAAFDGSRGGFGGAPKFPIPHQIGFLLRYGKRTGKSEALSMAAKTLRSMRRGGICDQLGYGFHRYSTDAEWLVPHFEKMLHDQALLAEVYAEAFAVTAEEEFRRTAREIADYVLRDLVSPEGGFHTAEDADSEGEEGRFYLWTRADLDEVLGPEKGRIAARIFGVEPGGNFAEPGRPRDGRNILHRPGLDLAGADAVEDIRVRLLEARAKRVPPFKDTKVLADQNGLMIAGLAAVFRVTGEKRYLEVADRAADFVLGRMRGADGGLLHVFAGGEARIPAFLDDHAFLVKGLIALYEAGFDPQRLGQALDLARRADELFGDDETGGYFFAGEDPGLPVRRKEIYDGAVPSGNSVMLTNLLRLARLTGRPDLEERASRLAEAFAAEVAAHPRMHTEFLRGLDLALGPSREVVVAGDRKAAATEEMLGALRSAYIPDAVVLFKPADDPEAARALERLAAFTRDMGEVGGGPAAYVCTGGRCLRPVTTAAELLNSVTHN